MPEYLVDANLPYYFSLWKRENFVHQSEKNESGESPIDKA